MKTRRLVFRVLVGLSFCATFATAQTNYQPLKNSTALFDEELGAPTKKPHADLDIDLVPLGWLAESTACQPKARFNKLFIPTQHNQLQDLPDEVGNAGFLLTLDRNLSAHSEAMQAVTTGPFVFLYRVTFNTGEVLDEWSRPLETISCMAGNLSEQSIGKIVDGLRSGDSADVTYGTTMTFATLAMIGSGVEAFQGTTLFSKVQALGRSTEASAGNLLNNLSGLSGVVRNGNALALQPRLAFAGAIPVARIAELSATGTAVMGNVMMMSATLPLNGTTTIHHRRYAGSGNHPPEGIQRTYERSEITPANAERLEPKAGEINETKLDVHCEADMGIQTKDSIPTEIGHLELSIGQEVLVGVDSKVRGLGWVTTRRFATVERIFKHWTDDTFRVVLRETRVEESAIGFTKREVALPEGPTAATPTYVEVTYKPFVREITVQQ